MGKELPSGKLKGILALRAKVREGLGDRGRACQDNACTKWYQSGNIFAFCSREEDLSCRPEEKGNRLVQRTGMHEEEVDRQGIQKWSGR